MNVLVVPAHPDDKLLGCGGTAARHGDFGGRNHLAKCTTRGCRSVGIEELKNCSQRVADPLGVKELSLHGLSDNRFDTQPLPDVIKIVEELIERWRPAAIHSHHGGDLNVDHQMLSRAVLTATRLTEDHPVHELYMFEIASSTE